MTLCATCNGKGVVPREAPKLPDGSIDPRYVATKFPALCPDCWGSGAAPEKVACAKNIAAAKAADGG
jgi:hypothetical protein